MRLLTAALVTSIALVGATAGPAAAERITITDPAHDHLPANGGQDNEGAGDVVKVRVDHAPKRVFIDTVFRTKPYDLLEIELDTRKSRPGPEFLLSRTPYGTGLWRDGEDELVKCADKRFRYLAKQRTWAAYVNRGCLRWPKKGDTPRQVRVHLLSASDDYYFTRDYVPRRNSFSRWVSHN